MQVKRVICPKCRAVLDVKNSQNEEVKQITCPSCKTILQVKFQPQQEPIEAKTFCALPKRPNKSGETQLAGSSYGATQLQMPSNRMTSKAFLQCGGVNYPLEEGQNIVGRKGHTSKATVQIGVTDRYMSRQHCSITVTTLPNGTKKAVLSNYQNKNQTAVDGQEIETGDAIRLTDGNCITMGHTTVTFKFL